MKKVNVILALLLSVTAQAQPQEKDTLAVSDFIATYIYQCHTQDADGKDVTDSIQLSLQVSGNLWKCSPNDKSEGVIANDQAYQEALMHVPTVWMGYPEGSITSHETLFPYIYETQEVRQPILWDIASTDTLTIEGYLSHRATATYKGKTWVVWYTEDIPSSAGPWKLGGLPGLILRAEDREGIHSFTLNGLLQEQQPIVFQHYRSALAFNQGTFTRQRFDFQKMEHGKFLKFKKKILGNKLYPQHPNFYAPNALSSFGSVEHWQGTGGRTIQRANGVVMLDKAHVYQPLELK